MDQTTINIVDKLNLQELEELRVYVQESIDFVKEYEEAI
ncbi:hypothetical protein LCGC14_1793800 [marine sediment metagenome]|uniref:Uncharacterized protein n=1 Tax=marine sediment metagenome TaxID=412755 RepID=A0A0F9GRQ3_9ZZZZ